MGMIKFTSKGSWWINSKTDPKWDKSGTSDGVGGFCKPPEVCSAIEKMKKELGNPPEDLEWGYMKN